MVIDGQEMRQCQTCPGDCKGELQVYGISCTSLKLGTDGLIIVDIQHHDGAEGLGHFNGGHQ